MVIGALPTQRTPTAYRAAVLASRPAGYWPLDEPVGSESVADVAGENTLRTVILRGTLPVQFGVDDPWGEPGAAHIHWSAEGENGIGGTSPPVLAAHFTIEGWLRAPVVPPQGDATWVYLWSPDVGNATPGWTVTARPQGDLDTLAVRLDQGGWRLIFPTLLTPKDNAWHHYAFTCDHANVGANRPVFLYVDGVMVPWPYAFAATPPPSPHPPTALGIGTRWEGAASAGWGMAGDTCHLALYDRALSSAEVAAHYLAAKEPEPPKPMPPRPATPVFVIEVTLDDMALNYDRGDTCVLVSDIDGWYDTPDPDPRDVERVLSDGAIFGPKTVRAREITLSGSVVVEDRADLFAIRDRLASRITRRTPVDLVVADAMLNERLTAAVRGVSALTWRPAGPLAALYSFTLRAADPRRYATDWQSVSLSLAHAEGGAGRHYPRDYRVEIVDEDGDAVVVDRPWRYLSATPPGTARVFNRGNAPAPVYATYEGPLSETRLTNRTSTIRVAELHEGEQITIDTTTLSASAPGGASRARYILAGSTPMSVAPATTETWQLLGSGAGSVTLEWRAAWS